MKTLIERTALPRKLKGKMIKTPDGKYLCVSIYPSGITLEDSKGKLKGIEWKNTCDFIVSESQ